MSHCPWKMKRVLLRMGARRVATQLASLGFFHFRRVLQENPNSVSSLSHLSRARPFPLRTQWSSARPCTHRRTQLGSSHICSGCCCWSLCSCLSRSTDDVQKLPKSFGRVGAAQIGVPKTGRLKNGPLEFSTVESDPFPKKNWSLSRK